MVRFIEEIYNVFNISLMASGRNGCWPFKLRDRGL